MRLQTLIYKIQYQKLKIKFNVYTLYKTVLHDHLIINHHLNYFKIIILKANKLIIDDEL